MMRPLPKHAYEQSELEQLRETMRGVKSKDDAMRKLQALNELLQKEVNNRNKIIEEQKQEMLNREAIRKMYQEMLTLETVIIAEGETYYLKGQDLEDFLRVRCFGEAAKEAAHARHQANMMKMIKLSMQAQSNAINKQLLSKMYQHLALNGAITIKKEKPLWPVPPKDM